VSEEVRESRRREIPPILDRLPESWGADIADASAPFHGAARAQRLAGRSG